MAAVKKDRSFASVEWDSQITVPVITLDSLIAKYGRPAFCKIDVEGFELEVLRGLHQPIPGISFEILPAAIGTAQQCIDYLTGIGAYAYNFSPGERHQFMFPKWLNDLEIHDQLTAIGSSQYSGMCMPFYRPIGCRFWVRNDICPYSSMGACQPAARSRHYYHQHCLARLPGPQRNLPGTSGRRDWLRQASLKHRYKFG